MKGRARATGKGAIRAFGAAIATVVIAAIASGIPACTGRTGDAPTADSGAAPRRASARPLLPRDAVPFAPAQIDVAEGGAPKGEVLADVDTCEGCHSDAAAQFRTSAHAFASFNNPAYRYAVERYRDDVGKTQSHFCAGCHDVSLLVDGAMDRAIDPGDVRGHTGVACRTCHGITRTRPDGNGSFTLRSEPLALPKKGDAASLRLHKEQAKASALTTPQMCGSCHRSFLGEATGNPSHLTGMDELTGWSQSPYAGSLLARIDDPVDLKECRDCHMPKEAAPLGDLAAKNGQIASHRFLGGHTWLAAMRGDKDTLAKAQARLVGIASIDVAAVVHDDGGRDLLAENVSIREGDGLTLDVVVRNLEVGHRFPGGTLDAQDAWIELTVRDARGRLVAEAGTLHEKTGDDETAHRFRAVQADANGEPQLARETHHFRAVVYNHTIAPRDAEVVRYRFDVPPVSRALPPFQVTARLRHRSRNAFVARAACAEMRSARGAAYAIASKRLVGQSLDACVAEPVTDIATRTLAIGPEEDARSNGYAVPAWRRLYDHALGLLHGPQERIDDARISLDRAAPLASGDDADSRRARAMIASLAAEVAVAEGRTSDALVYLDRAAEDAPDHPAIAAIRGEALASVWRFEEAVPHLRACARAAPNDSNAWLRLAVAAGSAGDSLSALDACAHGLAFQPRDADMLRVQALALARLDASDSTLVAAKDAYAKYRSPDDAPKIRGACARRIPGCALERIPVHVHSMRAVP